MSSLMQNWQDARDAVKASENSQGSAEKEQETMAQGVQYRMNVAQAEIQQLSYKFLSTDVLKAFLDFANGFLDILTKLTNQGHSLLSIFTALSGLKIFQGALTNTGVFAELFKALAGAKTGGTGETMLQNIGRVALGKNQGNKTIGQIIQQAMFGKGGIQNPFSRFKKSINEPETDQPDINQAVSTAATTSNNAQQAAKEMEKYADQVTNTAITTQQTANNIGKGMQQAGSGASGFAKALGGVGIAVTAVVVAFTVAAAIFDKVTTSYDQATQSLEDHLNKAQQAKQELDTINDQLSEKEERLSELDKIGNRSVEEQAEYQALKKQTEQLKTQAKLKESEEKHNYRISAQKADISLNKNQKTDGFWEWIGSGIYDAFMGDQAYQKKYHGADAKDITRMPSVIKQLQDDEEKIKELQGANSPSQKKINKANDKYSKDLDDAQKYVSQLQEYKEAYEGYLDNVGFDPKVYKNLQSVKQMLKEYNQMDMSPAQKTWDNLKSMFDGDVGESQLQDFLVEAQKNGTMASDAIQQLGTSVQDIGVPSDDLNSYIQDIINNTQEATDSVEELQGTFDSLSSAMESADQGQQYDKVSGWLSKIQENYDIGKVGTDDFQQAVEFFSPKKVSSPENINAYRQAGRLDAEAYTDEWANIKDKVKRYFSPDDESTEDVDEGANSVNNTLEDLTKVGLLTKQYDKQAGQYIYKAQDSFQSSKQAADKLGLSVQAWDVLLKNLGEYGLQLGDDFEFAGQNADNFKKSLDGLNDLYDKMKQNYGFDDPRTKAMKQLIDQYQQQYDNMQDDLSKQQVVKIKFDYDMADLQIKADQAGQIAVAGGFEDTASNAKLISANEEITNKQRDYMQQQGIEIPQHFSDLDTEIQKVQESMIGLNDPVAKLEKTMQIVNLQGEQQAIGKVATGGGTQVFEGYEKDAEGYHQRNIQLSKDSEGNYIYRVDQNGDNNFTQDEQYSQSQFEGKFGGEAAVDMSQTITGTCSVVQEAANAVIASTGGQPSTTQDSFKNKTIPDNLYPTAGASKTLSGYLQDANNMQNSIKNVTSALDGYEQNLQQAKQAQVDLNKTVYGNIDTNNRQKLEWNSDTLKQNKQALQSWDPQAQNNWSQYKKDMQGSYSTVMGASDQFDGVQIAFSPVLQTDEGPQLLTKNTVYNYINDLIAQAKQDDGQWSADELFQLDTTGLDEEGQHIQGLLADIGDTAEQTGEQMHFTGDYGSTTASLEQLKAAMQQLERQSPELYDTLVAAMPDELTTTLNVDSSRAEIGVQNMSQQWQTATQALKDYWTELQLVNQSGGANPDTSNLQKYKQNLQEAINNLPKADKQQFESIIPKEIKTDLKLDDTEAQGTADDFDKKNSKKQIKYKAKVQGLDQVQKQIDTIPLSKTILITYKEDGVPALDIPSGGSSSSTGGSSGSKGKNKDKGKSKGKPSYTGTIRAFNTSYAHGTIKKDDDNLNDILADKRNQTKHAGTALVGEQGPEILVHGTTWQTIGDKGAEFRHIPSNSVIFNADQTEELLRTGRINSRGYSYLSGTAYAYAIDGLGAVRGVFGAKANPNKKKTNSSKSSKKKSSSKKNSKSKSNSKSKGNNSNDNDSNKKQDDQNIDWIAVKIQRVEREITNLDAIVDGTYKNWSDRNTAIGNEINDVADQIAVQQQAYAGYMAAANAVGLSDDYKQKVQNGTIDIQKITDEDTRNKVSEYQKWYEKALACADAVEKLRKNLAALAKTRMDNVAKQFDENIDRVDNYISLLSSASDITDFGRSFRYAQEMVANETNNVGTLQTKLGAMQRSLQDAMNQGLIQQGTEAWYDMQAEIDKVSKSIVDARANVVKYAQETFTALENQYEAVTKRADHMVDVVNQLSDITESQGYAASALYNETMKMYETSNLQQYEQEYQGLQNLMRSALDNKQVAYGSSAWETLQEKIEGVADSILKAKKSIADYNKEIQKIKWDRFDDAEKQISRLKDESEFLQNILEVEEKLVEDDTGKFTNAGLATLGLHSVSYNTDISQLKDYRNEIDAINQQIAKDPYNKTLLDRRNDLIDSSHEMVKAAQDEKSAIKSLWKDAYDELLNGLQKLIDKRKDLLNDQSDLRDYENNVTDQTDQISSLQKQMMALRGDDSEQTQAQMQTLSKNLKDAQKDLDDTEYNKWKSDQEAMLDETYDQYEELINTRLDNIDELVSQTIEAVNNNATVISDTLTTTANEAGTTLSTTMQGIWNGSYPNIVSDFKGSFDNFTTGFNGVSTSIGQVRDYAKAIADYCDRQAAARVAAEQVANQAQSSNWRQDANGWYYDNGDGTYATNQWKQINGKWYSFDSNGYMRSNEWVDGYWVNANGEWDPAWKGSWSQNSKGWWYNYGNGDYAKNTYAKIDGKTYHFNNEGYWDDYGSGYNPGAGSYASTAQSSASSSGGGGTGFFSYRRYGGNKNGLNIDTSIVDRLKYHDYDWGDSSRASYYQAMGLGSASSYRGTSAQNRAMINWMKSNGLHEGGTIGRAIKLSGEDGFVLAKTGEQVLSLEKIKEMQNVFAQMNPIAKALNGASVPTGQRGNTNVSNDINMNITLPNVKNYDEFVTTMQSDTRFEKIVQSMTLGNAIGKNSLSKLKY